MLSHHFGLLLLDFFFIAPTIIWQCLIYRFAYFYIFCLFTPQSHCEERSLCTTCPTQVRTVPHFCWRKQVRQSTECQPWMTVNKWLIVSYICIVHSVWKAFKYKIALQKNPIKKGGKGLHFTERGTLKPLRDLPNVTWQITESLDLSRLPDMTYLSPYPRPPSHSRFLYTTE